MDIIYLNNPDTISEIIVKRMIKHGHWGINNLNRLEIEEFTEELISLARSRGESGHQLIYALNAHIGIAKKSAVN